MEVLVSLGLKILPYLAIFGALVYGYFRIKKTGADEVREEVKRESAEAVAKQTEKVTEAVGQDAAIDAKVKEQINEIEKIAVTTPVDDSRFRF